MLTIGNKEFPMSPMTPDDWKWFQNFIQRRLVFVYGLTLSQILPADTYHAGHDLEAVRYLAWLQTRRNGTQQAVIGNLINEDNKIEVTEQLRTA